MLSSSLLLFYTYFFKTWCNSDSVLLSLVILPVMFKNVDFYGCLCYKYFSFLNKVKSISELKLCLIG